MARDLDALSKMSNLRVDDGDEKPSRRSENKPEEEVALHESIYVCNASFDYPPYGRKKRAQPMETRMKITTRTTTTAMTLRLRIRDRSCTCWNIVK